MERSIELIVAGGLVLVAGLWVLAAEGLLGRGRYAGVAIVALGLLALGVGIGRELTHGPLAD